MPSPAPIHRSSSSVVKSSLRERFSFSLAIGCLVLAATAMLLAHLVIRGPVLPGKAVSVISSPSPERYEPLIESTATAVARPLPQPPAELPMIRPDAMVPLPLLATPSPLETSHLLAQSDEALLALELIREEEEAKRKEELQKEVSAQQERRSEASREQTRTEATPTKAQRIVSPPTVAHRISPIYPALARRDGIQGSTQIAVTITSGGEVSSPRITRSSGNLSLDSCALESVKKWRFNPAKTESGQAVAFQMTIPVTFRLK